MNVTLGLLADAANTTADSKLNVLGVFDRIFAGTFPAIHPSMTLVVRFEADSVERDQTKQIAILLVDADGAEVLQIQSEIRVQAGQGGEPTIYLQILGLVGVNFPHAGNYEFVIMIGGEPKHRVPLKLLNGASSNLTIQPPQLSPGA